MRKLLDIVLIWIPAAFLVLSILWVTAYKWIPVKWTPLMLKRTIEFAGEKDYSNIQEWVELDEISPLLVNTVILAEDQRFYSHNGFDVVELKRMKEDHALRKKELRGCSTISQQVAKNCFTFGSRTWTRKAIEAYYTVLIEFIWGKERILEVYMNVAETGKGLYGVEAACRRYFKCTAEELYLDDAVALACVLPKPLARTPMSIRTTHSSKLARLTKETLELIANQHLDRKLYEN
jgi:monofunctional biosynthetic peptidoglycan transglycosylase